MPIEVEIAPAGTKLSVTRRQDGKLLDQSRFDRLSSSQQVATARKCGIDVPTLLGWCEQVREANAVIVFRPVPPVKETVFFTIREVEQTNEQGEQSDESAEAFLTQKLGSIPKDKVFLWPDKAQLCCLDVDYHDGAVPHRSLLESVVLIRLSPRPFCWHFSRGGGLHLFYVATENLTAEELAAVAALRLRMIDPTAGVELKRVVRGPGDEPVFFSGGQDSSGLLLDWLREPGKDLEGQDDWLEEHHVEMGKRYPHTHCPVAASPDEGKHRDPVVIGEHGITCYVCEGAGRVWGSRRAGWFPWAAILGHPSAGDVGSMVRGLCHWGHARWVLAERYGVRGELAKLAYRAALKVHHAGKDTEPLIEGAFDQDTDVLARVGTDWVNIEGMKVLSKNIGQTLALLPFTQYLNDKGEIKTKMARVTNFLEPLDFRDRGYPPIRLIYGIKMAPDLASIKDATVAVPSPELKSQGGVRVLPKYVPFAKRMKVDKARQIIEQLIPGVNWNLIDLVLCGIGSTQETNLGSPPRIFVSGPSASAKSSHFHIASGIAGVTVSEPSMQGSDERLKQAIQQAVQQGPVLVINEIFKDSIRANRKITPTQALEPILTMEKNSMTHVLYKGAEKLGRQFVLGLTEIVLPPDIRAETQLARRIRYVPLTRSHPEWRVNMAAAGLNEFVNIRLGGPELVEACDAILSDCIDRFFVVPMSFDAQAEKLGIQTLQDSSEFEDPTKMLRHFFKLVCAAPKISNPRLEKLYSGFKQISRSETDGGDSADELFTVYSSFADGTGADWSTARKLQEKDWGMVLGVDQPVKIQMRTNGSSVFIRFQVGPMEKPELVNEQIVDPTDWSTL